MAEANSSSDKTVSMIKVRFPASKEHARSLFKAQGKVPYDQGSFGILYDRCIKARPKRFVGVFGTASFFNYDKTVFYGCYISVQLRYVVPESVEQIEYYGFGKNESVAKDIAAYLCIKKVRSFGYHYELVSAPFY